MDEFHARVSEFDCETEAPIRLVLIAPQPFYTEAERRSQQRYGEYERAIGWIAGLASKQVVSIDLYALDSVWQQQGIHFPTTRVRTR